MSDYFKHAQDPSNKHFDPIHITACYLDPVRNLVLDEKKTKIAIATLNKVKLEKIFILQGQSVKNIFVLDECQLPMPNAFHQRY